MRIALENIVAARRQDWWTKSVFRGESTGRGEVKRRWIQDAVARNFWAAIGEGGVEERMVVVRKRISSRMCAVSRQIPRVGAESRKRVCDWINGLSRYKG